MGASLLALAKYIYYAKNYFIVETTYWLQWLRHSMCILITKLHLQLVELSKTANINSQ